MTLLTVREVTSRQDWREFSRFKTTIYQSTVCSEEDSWEETRNLRMLSQGDTYRKAAAFLALQDTEIVGRIGVITDTRHSPSEEGFFGFFECIEDSAVARALLQTAAEKLRSWGKSVMLGPISASTNEKVGIMVEGFETLPHQNLTYNPPYYRWLLEENRLIKAMGLFSYLWQEEQPPSKQLSSREIKTGKEYQAKVIFPAKGHLQQEAAVFADVYNASLQDNWGFVPLTVQEAKTILLGYRFSPYPDLLFRLDVAGNPAGICMLQQNTRKGLRSTDPHIRAAVLGLKPEYRSKGLSTLIIREATRIVKEQGYSRAEISLIMENNHTVRSIIERKLQCPILHRYQVYRTTIS